jgi:hypothetical protein
VPSTDRSNRILAAALVLVAAAIFVLGPIIAGFTIDWTQSASAIRGVLALAAALLGLVGIAALLARLLRPIEPTSDLLTRPSEVTKRYESLLPSDMSYPEFLDHIGEQRAAYDFMLDRMRLSKAHITKGDADLAQWQDTLAKQELALADLRSALNQSHATLDRIISTESSRGHGVWEVGAIAAILGTVGFLAALLTTLPVPAPVETVVSADLHRTSATASTQLWRALDLEACELVEGQVPVQVLTQEAAPLVRLDAPECEPLEFRVEQGAGILVYSRK